MTENDTFHWGFLSEQEIQISKESVQEIKEKYDQEVRSVPQVIIDGEFVGGFAEVDSRIKGPGSINKV